ncbi:MAG: glycosyltransferase family 39 protein [Candidatus Woesearchaeota archaeon]
MYGKLIGKEKMANFNDILVLVKKKYQWFFLIIFILLGFYLRDYHIDFPSIGYHNMKENEYIDQVKAFYRGEVSLLHRYTSLSAMDSGPGYFEENPQMPLLSWLGALAWLFSGENISVLRLIVIIFSLTTIIGTYLLAKELSNNEYFSLLSAFFMAIIPLNVFFGRNIQPDTPALAMAIFFSYYMFRAMRTFDNKDFFIAGVFLALAGLFKYSFLIVIFPFIFLFPYQKFFEIKNLKKNYKKILYFSIGPLIMVFWALFEQFFIITSHDKGFKTAFFSRLHLFDIFTMNYWVNSWPAISHYLRDNFSWGLMIFFLLGIFFFFLKYKHLLSKYVLLFLASTILYAMLLSTYINAHSYYQLPFTHLFALGVAYSFFNIGILLKEFLGRQYLKYAPLLILIILAPSIKASTDVQFDTVFFGLDIAGNYLNKHMERTERFLVVGHAQSVAVCTYSDRRCHLTESPELDQLKFLEYNRSVSWIFIYDQYGFFRAQQNQEFFNYVAKNYKIAEAGFIGVGQNVQLKYLILKKGGILELNISGDNIQKVAEYKLTKMSIPFYIKNFDI